MGEDTGPTLVKHMSRGSAVSTAAEAGHGRLFFSRLAGAIALYPQVAAPEDPFLCGAFFVCRQKLKT